MPKNLRYGPNPLNFPDTVFGVSGATSAPVFARLRDPDTTPHYPITLEGMKIVGLDAGDYALSPLGSCDNSVVVLEPGAHCTIALTFTPHALGLRTARLKVFDNAHNRPQVFQLEGHGVRGRLQLSAGELFFGKVVKRQAGAPRTLTLTNPNPVALSIGRVAVFTTSGQLVNQFAKVSDTCADTQLAPAAQCTVTLTFDPTVVGVVTGDVRIHDDARHNPQNVYLQGTGIK